MSDTPNTSIPGNAPNSTYALILAGGSGQRFWPLSRDKHPKQLLKLFDDKTLLEHTIDRLEGLLPKENILVLTNHQQLEGVRSVLKDFPQENIIAEPDKRDTGPAIALAIGWVAAKDPNATMMVLPSDHIIKDREAFQQTLRSAAHAARQSQALVTIGITPTWPCPSYGYIERGEPFSTDLTDSNPVYEVIRFREKPSIDLAERFLEQGGFTWNAGMFFWTVSAVRNNLNHLCPELAAFVDTLANAEDFHQAIQTEFSKLPKLSIDYALMEKAPRVLNVEASFDWDDVGNWTSVGAYLFRDGYGNQQNCEVTHLDSGHNLVFSANNQHIAMLGVEHLMVVTTPDAILIAHRSEAEKIKKLVETLPPHLR